MYLAPTLVTDPTEWCAGMVVVPKQNDKVRICVDLTRLNESVERERHILPAVDQTLAQLAGAKIFSKLDANSGFWQVPLSTESTHLTTFITPFGRYCFKRLPFGITSAPEHFQRRMSEILEGISGVVCHMDDVLIHGKSQEDHDQTLLTVGLVEEYFFSRKSPNIMGLFYVKSPLILWVFFMYKRSLILWVFFMYSGPLILWGFFMYRASLIWSLFMYN